MDRITTIKVLRDITRKLSDKDLFSDDDFNYDTLKGDKISFSVVDNYIKRRLEL